MSKPITIHPAELQMIHEVHVALTQVQVQHSQTVMQIRHLRSRAEAQATEIERHAQRLDKVAEAAVRLVGVDPTKPYSVDADTGVVTVEGR